MTQFLSHLCAAHAHPEHLPSHRGQDAAPARVFPSMLHPRCCQGTVPLSHQTLQHSLRTGETKNPTLYPPVALPLTSVHTDCSLLIRGTASALPHKSCSGLGLHGPSTATPLDQTEIGKHREGGQICAALATTLSMHMDTGDVPNTPQNLCSVWAG